MMSNIFKVTCTLLAIAVLSGCEAGGKIIQVIADPSIQVGDDDDQPSEITLQAYAAAEVNKNFEGEPSPIVVKVFALSSDHRLFTYDYFSLTENTGESLGVTLKENLDENMLEPDTYKILGPYEMPKGTKKIGVIAEYLDIESATWKASFDVEAFGSDDDILMLLLEEEVRLIEQE